MLNINSNGITEMSENLHQVFFLLYNKLIKIKKNVKNPKFSSECDNFKHSLWAFACWLSLRKEVCKYVFNSSTSSD